MRSAWRHPVTWLAVGAIALRLLLFLGRGDYVAFDEGWYLLLGRNLWAGDGFTLSGLRHVALSPLFPILAGALDLVVPSPVWAGRIVAAVAGGLLVVPVWAISTRLAGRRTALLACALVAALPSLAPFVVPYWIGWDLWVGAEPLLHLLLFTGIALSLRALERRRALDWGLAGAAFGLAYLARPEAVIVATAIGIAAAALALREGSKALARPIVFGLAFALVALPYWLYLRDALGRWALTGRDVAASAPALKRKVAEGLRAQGAAGPVERMLWEDDEDRYVRVLYALDASGTRLANGYWGVGPAARKRVKEGTAGPARTVSDREERPPEPDHQVAAAPDTARAGEAASAARMDTVAAPGKDGVAAASVGQGAGPSRRSPPSRLMHYARSLGVVVPWFVWPFVVIGAIGRGRRRWLELLVVLPLAMTSVAVAFLVAIDPRTQLFLAPALAFYAARGIRLMGTLLTRQAGSSGVRRGFATGAIAAVMLALLLGTSARRLYMSLSIGSPHHIVGAENRRAADELKRLLAPGEPVMSWHPALALYADRDWRVLPYAPLDRIVRYAAVNGIGHIVLSGYYPPPWTISWIPGEYLILRVPADAAHGGRWRVETTPVADRIALGELRAEPPDSRQ